MPCSSWTSNSGWKTYDFRRVRFAAPTELNKGAASRIAHGGRMKLTKLKQRLGSTLRITSLVLCILLSLLWVRSCAISDLITLTTADHYYEFATIPGSICFAIAHPIYAPTPMT